MNDEINLCHYDINKINKKYFEEAKRLLPDNKYIGLSLTQGNIYRKKSWSIKNFINLSKSLVEKGFKPVFFIKKDEKDLINKIKSENRSAIFPELNTELDCPALITALSTRLDKAISIDNGLMHMIALADIPMIVLFGPTNSEKFAPKNKFTSILDSKKIHKTKDINSIAVDEVLSLI